MILPQSLDLVLAVLVLRALLMRDSPNRTLHVVPTLFSPAQKAIDFFVVRRRQSSLRRRGVGHRRGRRLLIHFFLLIAR